MKWILVPFHACVHVRYWWLRRNTVGSVTILLGIIASANVIWGYPLGSLLSSFIVMLILASIVNSIYLPRFEVEVESPSQLQCGSTFTFVCVLRNTHRWTQYDLEIDIERGGNAIQLNSPSLYVEAIGSRETVHLAVKGIAKRRGIHDWPAISIETSFPFGLFRRAQILHPVGSIVVTPRLLASPKIGAISDRRLSMLAQRANHASGETNDYHGSREWLPTLPLKRWDFAAWARLGKPIARDYVAAKALNVTLWVDASYDEVEGSYGGWPTKEGSDHHVDRVEAVYSLSATMIRMFERHGFRCGLYLSCDREGKINIAEHGRQSSRELMRRLAGGGTNTVRESHESWARLIGKLGDTDLLVRVVARNVGQSNPSMNIERSFPTRVVIQEVSIDQSLHVEVSWLPGTHQFGRARSDARTVQRFPATGIDGTNRSIELS